MFTLNDKVVVTEDTQQKYGTVKCVQFDQSKQLSFSFTRSKLTLQKILYGIAFTDTEENTNTEKLKYYKIVKLTIYIRLGVCVCVCFVCCVLPKEYSHTWV